MQRFGIRDTRATPAGTRHRLTLSDVQTGINAAKLRRDATTGLFYGVLISVSRYFDGRKLIKDVNAFAEKGDVFKNSLVYVILRAEVLLL